MEFHIGPCSVEIFAGTNFQLPLVIEKKNTMLSYEFESKDYDVQFEIVKVEKVGEETVRKPVLPELSYSSNTKCTGSKILNECGEYLLIWDNTHSWLREKKINYHVTLSHMEATVEERNAYNRSITNGTAQLSKQLDETMHSLEEKEKELNGLTNKYQEEMQKMQEKQVRIEEESDEIGCYLCRGRPHCRGGEYDPRVREPGNDEGERDSELWCGVYVIVELRVLAPFLLESERILSMLPGVDLLRVWE